MWHRKIFCTMSGTVHFMLIMHPVTCNLKVTSMLHTLNYVIDLVNCHTATQYTWRRPAITNVALSPERSLTWGQSNCECPKCYLAECVWKLDVWTQSQGSQAQTCKCACAVNQSTVFIELHRGRAMHIIDSYTGRISQRKNIILKCTVVIKGWCRELLCTRSLSRVPVWVIQLQIFAFKSSCHEIYDADPSDSCVFRYTNEWLQQLSDP